MSSTTVRAGEPGAQDELVPNRMDLVAEWDTPERIAFELWLDEQAGDGLILTIADRPAEIAADVHVVGEHLGATWRGRIAEQPPRWLNAQRARAAFLYSKEIG